MEDETLARAFAIIYGLAACAPGGANQRWPRDCGRDVAPSGTGETSSENSRYWHHEHVQQLRHIFQWNDKYDTDIALIDEQHRTLVALAQSAHRPHRPSVRRPPTLGAGIRAAARITPSFTFSSEEEIWARYLDGDEWQGEHHATHEKFIRRTRATARATISGSRSVTSSPASPHS